MRLRLGGANEGANEEDDEEAMEVKGGAPAPGDDIIEGRAVDRAVDRGVDDMAVEGRAVDIESIEFTSIIRALSSPVSFISTGLIPGGNFIWNLCAKRSAVRLGVAANVTGMGTLAKMLVVS